jgi:hypothetical protein
MGGSLPLWPPPLHAQNAARFSGGGPPQSETTEMETLDPRLAGPSRSVTVVDSIERVRAATLARRRYSQMARNTHAAAAPTPAMTPMTAAVVLSTIPARLAQVPSWPGNEHAVLGRAPGAGRPS